MQKSLLDITRAVSTELNLPQPSVVISSQETNVLKLYGFTTAVCDDLLADFDWQMLESRYSLATSDGVDNYAFPSDIDRFISGTFNDGTNRWPWMGPLTPGQWEWLKTGYNTVGPYSRYRVWQDRIYLMPTPTATLSFYCEYISNNYVLDGNTGLPKNLFEQDSDICRFDHRVVIYGVKLKWLASIGQDTTAALGEYNRALSLAKAQDAPAPVLSLDGSASAFRLLSNANFPDGYFGS